MKNSGETVKLVLATKKPEPPKKQAKKAATKKPAPKPAPAEKDKRLGNLKPFKKGQTGNPNGRPKKLPALDALMAEVLGEEQNGMTAAKAILAKLRQKAVAGDVRASEILLDRAYGKAKQALEITERTIFVEHPDEEDE